MSINVFISNRHNFLTYIRRIAYDEQFQTRLGHQNPFISRDKVALCKIFIVYIKVYIFYLGILFLYYYIK